MVATDDEKGRIALSQNGDHAAFESLIKQYQQMIHALCYRMSGSMAQAEDLAQETFIHAYQHLKSFRWEARFSSWLYRIAMNLCLNWRASDQRRQALHRTWAEEARQPDRASENPARTEEIQRALLQLKPKQRAAIVLTTFEGMSHGEAAQVLGCAETTVSWRVFAARAKLKKLLKHLQP